MSAEKRSVDSGVSSESRIIVVASPSALLGIDGNETVGEHEGTVSDGEDVTLSMDEEQVVDGRYNGRRCNGVYYVRLQIIGGKNCIHCDLPPHKPHSNADGSSASDSHSIHSASIIAQNIYKRLVCH